MLIVNCHAGATAYFGWGRASNNSFMGGLNIGSQIIVQLVQCSWLMLKSLTIGSSRGFWISQRPKFTLKISSMKMIDIQPGSCMDIHLSGKQQTKIMAFLVRKREKQANKMKWMEDYIRGVMRTLSKTLVLCCIPFHTSKTQALVVSNWLNCPPCGWVIDHETSKLEDPAYPLVDVEIYGWQ